MREPPRLCLSRLRRSRAAKAQGKNFCSRGASSASQKFILAPRMSLLRITLGGTAVPPNLPQSLVLLALTVASRLVMKLSAIKRENVAESVLKHPYLTNPLPASTMKRTAGAGGSFFVVFIGWLSLRSVCGGRSLDD